MPNQKQSKCFGQIQLKKYDFLDISLFVNRDEDTYNEKGGFFLVDITNFVKNGHMVLTDRSHFLVQRSSIGSSWTNKFLMRQVFKDICGKDFLYIKFVNMD